MFNMLMKKTGEDFGFEITVSTHTGNTQIKNTNEQDVNDLRETYVVTSKLFSTLICDC